MIGKPDLQSLLARQLPVTLTKAEALEYAAHQLDQMAAGVETSARLLNVMSRLGLGMEMFDGDMRALIEALKKGLVDTTLQVASAKAGASAIRELALEERIFAARAGADASMTK